MQDPAAKNHQRLRAAAALAVLDPTTSRGRSRRTTWPPR